MSEILPDAGQTTVEGYIGFLMQAEYTEGAVSTEPDAYRDILARYRAGVITDEQAKEEAEEVSSGRGANVH